jgi:hypothetical protein
MELCIRILRALTGKYQRPGLWKSVRGELTINQRMYMWQCVYACVRVCAFTANEVAIGMHATGGKGRDAVMERRTHFKRMYVTPARGKTARRSA